MWISLLFAEADYERVLSFMRDRGVKADQVDEVEPVEGERVAMMLKDAELKGMKKGALFEEAIPYILDYGTDDGIIRGHIACDGKERAHVFAEGSWIMLPFDPKLGDVAAGAVAGARRFTELHERAMKAMEEREKQTAPPMQKDLFENILADVGRGERE